VIGVVAPIVVAVVAERRARPRRSLEYTVRVRRLVQARADMGLEIIARGVPITDPHLVEFRLKSNSRADIPSSAFDGGRELVIRVEPGGALVLGSEGARGGIKTHGGDGDGWDWAEFRVGPQLIRRGDHLEIDFISNGRPGVQVSSPVIDVAVLDVSSKPDRASRILVYALDVIAVVLLLMLVVAPPLFGGDSFNPGLSYAVNAVVAASMIGFAAACTYLIMWRRPR
jgi:hypothetical protein